MKKRLYLLLLTVAMVLTVAACGKKKDTNEKKVNKELQEDLTTFVNEKLPAIESKRNNAVKIYNSYFESNDVDLEAFATELQGTAIPDMTSYIDELSAIELKTDEVKSLRDLYLQSAQKQLDAMNKVSAALAEQNPDYLSEADALIDESSELLLQYQTNLRKLALDNDIKINGDFQTSTSTDATATDAQ